MIDGDLARPWALVSMPWFWAYLPSIQLAIVKDELETLGIKSETFEFYADMVEQTGINLYKAIANDSGYIGELVFSQFYFDKVAEAAQSNALPILGFGSPEIESHTLAFLTPVVEAYLDNCFASVDWSRFDVICFSLTASQTSASMVMARKIKAACPGATIIFGGTSCAGEMGTAIAEMCPEADIVVHAEAEAVLPHLTKALADKDDLATVPGISWRCGSTVTTNQRAPLHRLRRRRKPLNFDGYFARTKDNSVLQQTGIWIPFESSRGCWYGEKSQCTFCGLNEIIQYRERGSEGLIDELTDYETRYGARNFFAVDLIMPLSFFNDFLPEVDARGKKWTIFYEIKSNLRAREIDLLVRAGVRWIQPGIESLDDAVLKIMRKGVSAAHNIQTLKLCAERGITASWNLIFGFPRETAASYHDMAALFPKLHHLLPPVGFGEFEVHRFSPFFEAPEAHGIALRGAFPAYQNVYDVEPSLLDRLVYRFQYERIEPIDDDLRAAQEETRLATEAWRAAARRHAAYFMARTAGGVTCLHDTRVSEAETVTPLSDAQVALLNFLYEMKPENRVIAEFVQLDPSHSAALGGYVGIANLIESWVRDAIILRMSGYLLALPLPQAKADMPDRTIHSEQRRDEDANRYESAGADARHREGFEGRQAAICEIQNQD